MTQIKYFTLLVIIVSFLQIILVTSHLDNTTDSHDSTIKFLYGGESTNDPCLDHSLDILKTVRYLYGGRHNHQSESSSNQTSDSLTIQYLYGGEKSNLPNYLSNETREPSNHSTIRFLY